jgi:hypothetical protein
MTADHRKTMAAWCAIYMGRPYSICTVFLRPASFRTQLRAAHRVRSSPSTWPLRGRIQPSRYIEIISAEKPSPDNYLLLESSHKVFTDLSKLSIFKPGFYICGVASPTSGTAEAEPYA